MALAKTNLYCAHEFVLRRILQEGKSTHPWIYDHIIDLIACMYRAECTNMKIEALDACSQGIPKEIDKYVQRELQDLAKLQRGSKAWMG